MFDELVAVAEESLEAAKANMTGDAVDMAAKFLSDFNSLGESLGFK